MDKPLKEGHIRVMKLKGELVYTAFVRNIYFLFRGKWRSVAPMWDTDYDKVEQRLLDNI